ncbi:E3 ubiquitin-protein ligase TM129 isoform X1 [Schistocerca nitens]|uniref:E3 ubiquitin-protein ligase TM129 isoform X1 n=2 Tax=Schistocerca nitens TaxID=7011 RepID=UPI00211732A3|nr:E3 ubiquitin-protein ligase TM129 isoform X1 [Schistocerca nitens]
MALHLFTLFYIAVSICFIYPTSAFVYAGLTVEELFSCWLGSEFENFVLYHIRRSSITILSHSLLPLGYLVGLCLFITEDLHMLFFEGGYLWNIFVIASVLLPIATACVIWTWWKDNWKRHPICQTLRLFATENTAWESVASDINLEFRRLDKFCVQTSPVTKVVATDNWVFWVRPYGMDCAHQSDTALIVCRSDTHHIAPESPIGTQFLNIEVRPTRQFVPSFTIRLESTDFRDLQDKISRPITVLQNVTLFRSLSDQFLETFRELVAQNPHYRIDEQQELEPCAGCMQIPSNVKLERHCENTSAPDACSVCYCRPMWCVDCMGRWFASRQDQQHPETWLSSKCTCPLCRSTFCILDVCMIQK